MKLQLSEGTYVLAISGGVDSMALMHMAYTQYKKSAGYTFIVAHFNHGIRKESGNDTELVKRTAYSYGFTFAYEEGNLGSGASENAARTARYAFLRTTKQRYHAQAIVTAHHQDDVIETMLLHIARGTGRRGLAPMQWYNDILRPLLMVAKEQLMAYAHAQKLAWNEDATNALPTYTRNALRSVLTRTLTPAVRKKLVDTYVRMTQVNQEASQLASQLTAYVTNNNHELIRARFVLLEHSVACEVVYIWLQAQQQHSLSKALIEQVVHAVKTLPQGKKIQLPNGQLLQSYKNVVKFCKNV